MMLQGLDHSDSLLPIKCHWVRVWSVHWVRWDSFIGVVDVCWVILALLGGLYEQLLLGWWDWLIV